MRALLTMGLMAALAVGAVAGTGTPGRGAGGADRGEGRRHGARLLAAGN